MCCRFCQKLFGSKEKYLTHQCKIKSNKTKTFICDKCGKAFSQKICLQYHLVYVHNGERKAACPHCDFRAPDKAKLSLHLRIHSKVRPYVCEICNASFKVRSTYRSHFARHTNSGNHVCTHCCKTFTIASELEEHIRIHGVERPFACMQCGMTFKQQKRLKVHTRAVHQQDKRFICNVCGSCHINSWNLRTHMKTHTRTSVSYSNICVLCGSSFIGKARLAAHVRIRHPDMIAIAKSDEDEVAIEHIPDISPNVDALDLKMIEVYSCNVCESLFDTVEQLSDHTASEHGDFLYSNGN